MSRSWLYRQPDLRADIDRLRRVATTQAVPIPPAERGSAQSLQQRLNAALDEITRLKTDNHQLRQHLGHRRQNHLPTPSTTCLPHETQAQTRTRQRTPQHYECVKRAAFGFRRFTNYRIRALLYAGKPNWTLLNTITPP